MSTCPPDKPIRVQLLRISRLFVEIIFDSVLCGAFEHSCKGGHYLLKLLWAEAVSFA